MKSRVVLACLLCSLLNSLATNAADPKPSGNAPPGKDRIFECRFTRAAIEIDGKADDAAWARAEVVDYFYMPWLRDKARLAKTSTKARLLWDRENLYYFAEMEDADLYADVAEHDGMTWDNDVFELFFKPDNEKPGYYEFQTSAAGTIMDMFIPKRNAGGYKRFIKDGDFAIEAKVVRRGTLNDWKDKDEGWSVEGKIPWRGFARTGGRPEVNEVWNFTLCRYDYSVDFEGPELSVCAPMDSQMHPDFHHFEDYAKLKFLGPDLAEKKQGGLGQLPAELAALRDNFLKVPSKVTGSPDPPLPYRATRVLPKLKLTFPVCVINEPGSRRLWFIDQQRPYGPTRLCRTAESPESGEFETLMEIPEGRVAYSLEFHPKFAENGYVYIGWNGPVAGGPKQSTVTRFTVSRTKPHAFDQKSALDIIQWPSDGHNGVAIVFGRDGMLYVTSGDGTSDSDTNIAGQGLDHLLSKLLRIDVDHPQKDRAYSVPKDNPFIGTDGVAPETFAYGFRNPWRITCDQQTGDIWVGNNGQDLWEQAYLVKPGANYGWSVYEGSHEFYPERKLGPTPVSKPTFEHPHSEARSLTGGVVYYGKKLPELVGAYIYGDHSTGKIWAGKVRDGKVLWHKEIADTPMNIPCFAIDGDGELLIADHRGNNEGGFYTLEKTPVDEVAPRFPRKLSESGLFANVAKHELHPGVIRYEVNSPLWSDGAYKERAVYIAPEKNAAGELTPSKIDVMGTNGWTLPNGSVTIKSFALETREGDPSSRKWVETRFMLREQSEWVGYSYKWNDEQTEAFLVDSFGTDQPFEIKTPTGKTREQVWHYPARSECMVCHSRAANYVLGLSSLQFNHDRDYEGERINQLEVLEWLGVVKTNLRGDMQVATRNQREAKPSSLLVKPAATLDHLVDPYDDAADLTLRAKSYLHTNCSVCHVEAGGGNSQMELGFVTALDKMRIVDTSPQHQKFNLPDAKLIAPGHPERSVLLHRMSLRERGQMPQLATSIADQRAIDMIRKWIEQLK